MCPQWLGEKKGLGIDIKSKNEKRTGSMFCFLKVYEIDFLSESVNFIFQLQNGVFDGGNML
jgi:hypothetical protein